MDPLDPNLPFAKWFNQNFDKYFEHLVKGDFLTIVHSDLTNNNIMIKISESDDI